MRAGATRRLRSRRQARPPAIQIGLIVVLGLLLVAPGAAGVPFLQWGADAGHTGDTNDPGPSEYEIALNLQLPGEAIPWAPVPIIDRSVYVLTRAFEPATFGIERPELDRNALWRVNADTGEREELVAFETRPAGLGSDGQRFFVMTQRAIQAHQVATGQLLWSLDEPAGPPGAVQQVFDDKPADRPQREVVCTSPAVSPDLLVVACAHAMHDDGPNPGPPAGDSPVHPAGAGPAVVHAIDPVSGEVLWQWSTDGSIGPSHDPQTHPPRANDVPWRLVRTGDLVALATQETTRLSIQSNGEGGGKENFVWVLDVATGETMAVYTDTFSQARLRTGPGAEPTTYHSTPTDLLLTETTIHFAFDRIHAFTNPGLEFEWEYQPPLGRPEMDLLVGPDGIHNAFHAMAHARQTLYLARGHDLYALKTGELPDGEERVIWQARGPTDGEPVSTGDLLVARERLFTVAIQDLEGDVFLTVFSTADGEELWTHRLPERDAHYNPMTMGLGEGLWAVMSWKGELTIVGRTEASIQPSLSLSNLYPALEEPVRVDLSGTSPGLQGGQMAYAAVWGDGSRTDWQASPVLNQTYYEPGEHEALFMVRNEHGQYATQSVIFDVGGSQPNLVETAFARENQDLTFGVLGILVALIGGLIALGRRRRRRTILQRELDAINAAYDRTHHDAALCEAALNERRAHIGGLLLDGKLDEPQVALLERRIDDLGQQLRLGVLDDRFQFLPHGMVLALRDMLGDGRISAWEREHVLQAIDEDDVLTSEQKGKVRSLVDGWYERDGGMDV